MAYTVWNVVFGEQPTAAKWNQLGANDAGFKDGTNIDDNAIVARHYANASLAAAKTNFGGNYSTSEVNTGFKWINGKDIYKKTIAFGALPNNTSKSVAHGITTIERVMDIQSEGYEAAGPYYYRFGHVNVNSLANQISIYLDGTSIVIQTGSNRTGVNANITIFYTKV